MTVDSPPEPTNVNSLLHPPSVFNKAKMNAIFRELGRKHTWYGPEPSESLEQDSYQAEHTIAMGNLII